MLLSGLGLIFLLTKRRRSIDTQYSNIAPRLSAQNCNLLFLLNVVPRSSKHFYYFFCLSIPKRDLDKKKTTLHREVCPESLGVC